MIIRVVSDQLIALNYLAYKLWLRAYMDWHDVLEAVINHQDLCQSLCHPSGSYLKAENLKATFYKLTSNVL